MEEFIEPAMLERGMSLLEITLFFPESNVSTFTSSPLESEEAEFLELDFFAFQW